MVSERPQSWPPHVATFTPPCPPSSAAVRRRRSQPHSPSLPPFPPSDTVRSFQSGEKKKTKQKGETEDVADLLRFLPYSFLCPPRLHLKLPSPMTVFFLILLTYFAVISGLVYDIIMEPPGIGSTQDRSTGAVRRVVFLLDHVNGHYIIEGLSSGFMFVLGDVGLILITSPLTATAPAASIPPSLTLASPPCSSHTR